MSVYTLPLADPSATLEKVGGKGTSLAKLSAGGLPVPTGFHITTEAYRLFVKANDLQPRILAALRGLDVSHSAALDAASRQIQAAFAASHVPDDLAAAIHTAYDALGGTDPAVAVRSSATAEDLPEASFAGQQESYLNIRGKYALLGAVRDCWASLWTARAIAYRARQGTSPEAVDLAVVVQQLVVADASGVMFTSNPVTGKRNQIIITATWGLGEAIVSGAVTPDALTVEKESGRVIHKEISTKTRMTVRTSSGTTEADVPVGRQKKPVLNQAQSSQLARLGVTIEDLYGMPMDIEWTLEGGEFRIVQARPITALPPDPGAEPPLEWPLPRPKAVMARGSLAEFVPEPVSPLFATMAVPIARKLTVDLMGGIGVEGEDSYLMEVINDYVYVGFQFTPKMVWQFIVATVVLFPKLLKTAADDARNARAGYAAVVAKWQERDMADLSPSELLQGAKELFTAAARYYTVAQSGTIPVSTLGETTFSTFYRTVVKRKSDPDACKFLFGTESQPLRAEKALFDLAMKATLEPALEKYLQTASSDAIWGSIRNGVEAAPGLKAFGREFCSHLAQYGTAIYDLDFAKPVAAEDPAPLLEAIKVYLSGSSNPYERQRLAIAFREQAAASIAKRLDPLRRKYFLKWLKSALDTAPGREDSIADMGLGYPQLRRMLNEFGRRLTSAGATGCADDVYWLEWQELQEFAQRLEQGQLLSAVTDKVESRRTKWQAMRRISPPSTLPKKTWMSAFFPSNEASGLVLKGFGASAGKVSARACVMLGPEDFDKMQNGDAIVAGITTPAWTPLFARAAAIVTDIGGPLSHSSIVAREYGIPAVLATGVGTRRIRDGQTITVDGSAGTVLIAST